MTDVLDRIGDQLEQAELGLWRTAQTGQARRVSPVPKRAASWLRRHLIVVAALIGISGVAGGVAVADSLGERAINPQAWVEGQRVQPESAVSSDQSAFLGILRRPRTPADALPPAEAHVFLDSPAAANGANVTLARRAQGFSAGAAAWIVPGNGMICFIFDNPPAGGGGTCQPDASVSSGGFPVLTGAAGAYPGISSVAGVVPDGVSEVTLAIIHKGTVVVPVHENVYMATIHGGLASVTYQGPNGPVVLGN